MLLSQNRPLNDEQGYYKPFNIIVKSVVSFSYVVVLSQNRTHHRMRAQTIVICISLNVHKLRALTAIRVHIGVCIVGLSMLVRTIIGGGRLLSALCGTAQKENFCD